MYLMKNCCFFGHRRLFNKEDIRNRLYTFVETLIQRGYKNFLIGTHGEFDNVSLSVCRELRKKYHIKITIVFTSVAKLSKPKNSDVSDADLYNDCETLIYDIEEVFYKNQITISNQKMIDNSDYVICYVDETKSPSGAKKAMKYAVKHNKEISNLFLESDNPTYSMTNQEKNEFWKNLLNN